MLRDIGAPELLIILAIVVVLFGASRVAQIGGAVGRGIREFRHELKGPEAQENAVAQEEPAPQDGKRAAAVQPQADHTWFHH